MNILILGEYSGFIKNLVCGLKSFEDIHITIFAQQDGYKTIKQDVECYNYKEYGNFVFGGIEIRKSFLLRNIVQFFKFKSDVAKFKKYFDIVFIVNPEFIRPNYWIFQPLYSRDDIESVLKPTGKVFLSSCGFDYANVKFLKDTSSVIAGHISEKYNSFFFTKLNKIAFSLSQKVIPVGYTYAESYRRYLPNIPLGPTIPLPFDASSVPYTPNMVKNKIRIFNGVLRPWKGQEFTNRALDIISKKYSDKVEIIYERKPYADFIHSLSEINIYMDQCGEAYGVASLVAMSAGCVTFTGFTLDSEKEYGIDNIPLVGITYDIDQIVSKLEWWIEHPHEMLEFGRKSREYVEKHHNPVLIASRYLSVFNN